MKLTAVSSMLVFAVLAVAESSRADEKPAPLAAQRFEALKQLAGDWVEVGKDGKPTDKLVSSIRVTAAGSVVQETLFPGTAKEMVTMYNLDGADLVLTHYCMLGNQPRMKAEPAKDVNKIVFEFTGGGNLKSNDDRHMHRATLTIDGKDHYQAHWVACQDGKACHEAKFDLVRKPK